MTKRHKCPKCSFQKAYVIRRGKVRCLRCRYEWRPDRLPLQLEASEWESILNGFLQDLSSQKIALATGINRWRVMRALSRVRSAMLRDLQNEIPVFGLLRWGGEVLANLVPESKAAIMIPSISRRIKKQVSVFSGPRKSLSRLADRALSIGGGKRFERYLEEKLSVKRGIRENRWPLFFAEYLWRYKHRDLTVNQQISEVMRLMKNRDKSGFPEQKVS